MLDEAETETETETETDDAGLLDDKSTDGDEALDKAADDEDKSDEGGLLSDDGDAETESVEYTLELPEGFELNEAQTAALDEFKSKAKDLGLSQEQFQGLIDMDIERSAKEVDAAEAQYRARIAEWKEATKTDPTVGGDQLKASLDRAKAVLRQFPDPEFRALLGQPSEENPNGFGLENHPATIRWLNLISKALGDPDLVTSDGEPEKPPRTLESAAGRMYPTMQKKTA